MENDQELTRNAWLFIFATVSFLTTAMGLISSPFQIVFLAIWALIALVTGAIWLITVMKK